MQAIKDAKRRIVETTAERLGRSERVAQDEEEFKLHLNHFKDLEMHYKLILDHLRSANQAMSKMTERHLVLADKMTDFFASSSDADSQSVSHSVQAVAHHTHHVLQTSSSQVVDSRVLQLLDHILRIKIPTLKKQIVDHKNLETDVSAYTRKLKSYVDHKRGNTEQDAEFLKIKDKFDRANAQYSQLHTNLLVELKRLEEERYSVIKPLYFSYLAAHGELLAHLSREWMESIHPMASFPCCVETVGEVQEWVGRGGVPTAVPDSGKRTSSSSNNMFTSRLFSSSKSMTKTRPPPPPPSSSFATADSSSTAVGFRAGSVVMAMHAYEGTDEGDLQFQQGDRIVMVEELNKGWWTGTLEDGTLGLFPETYVSLVKY